MTASPSPADPASGDDRRLDRILAEFGEPDAKIVSRPANPYASSHGCRIVQYRLASGETLSVFVKRTSEIEDFTDAHGGGALSRGRGLVHEIETYRRVLRHAPLATPRYLGSWIDRSEPSAGLAIENLEGAARMNHVVEFQESMRAAAEWLGRFHRFGEEMLRAEALSFLPRFRAESLEQRRDSLLRRNASLIEQRNGELLGFLDAIEDRLADLLDSAPTIVHGEYYPKNILVRDDEIVPVDWETTLVGPGEIDLAMLLEGWGSAMREECLDVYARARFGAGPNAALRRRLAAARVFVHVYWLGYSQELEGPEETGAAKVDELERAIEDLLGLARSGS